MCSHKNSGGKGTKKIPHMQAYGGKSFNFVVFVGEMRVFLMKIIQIIPLCGDYNNYRFYITENAVVWPTRPERNHLMCTFMRA